MSADPARFDFADETVIVTGGSSGIGRAIALRFGEAGATVVNADVRERPKDLDASAPTHEAIRDRGGEARYVETDVSDRAQLEAVVEAAGGVDVMVNNAAIHVGGAFTEITPSEYDRIHAVNARGTFFGTQVAAEDMIERGVAGAVVNTASISASEVQAENAVYESTKASVKMITRSASFALADRGIRVNAVAPGHTATEFMEGLTELQHEKADTGGYLKPLPLGRPADPEDIAGTVLFLASGDADYITGELVHVDGGWHVL